MALATIKKPIEVAVIGGGCASIAAAFELTRPEHYGKYHVTIYQVGWRLGGKGASSRGPADRIEEHGFHVWLGFYENAFRLLRECYAELIVIRKRLALRIARRVYPRYFYWRRRSFSSGQVAELDRTFSSHGRASRGSAYES